MTLSIVFVIGYVLVGFVAAFSDVKTTESFAQNVVLDTNGGYTLFWNFNETHITFEVHVRTKGWVSLGISDNGNMYPSDVVVGWITSNGSVHFSDRHVTGHSVPIMDKSQDWHLLYGEENQYGTILKFVRLITTCDTTEDKVIQLATTRLIYAYGASDPSNDNSITYHGTARGTKSISLLSKTYGPSNMPSGVKHFDFLNHNYMIPTEQTTYWCRGFVMPAIGKHHMIKYEPIITPGNEMHVHHMLVYRCKVNNPSQYDGKSGRCYDPRTPDLPECADVVIAWAVGGQPFYFPDHVGYSIGGPDDEDFYILETHYDNPTHKAGMIDDSGIRITLTSVLKPVEAGLLLLGHDVYFFQIVPPGQPSWVTKAYCSSDCLNKAFTESNITEVKAFAAFQHAHLLGVAISTRHFRNGTEIKPLYEELTYDFNFQEFRVLPNEVSIRPGDSFQVDCKLDSRQRNSVTLGGFSTRDEMCLSFVYYYPKSKLARCLSLPNFSYFNIASTDVRHFIGTSDWNNQTWVDQFRYGLEHGQVYQGCYGNKLKGINNVYTPSEPSKPYTPPHPHCS